MVQSVAPFLMFEGRAEEAMNLYISVVPNSGITELHRYGPAAPGKENWVMFARFSLAGAPVICNDSIMRHSFTFTPSTSLHLACESEEELDRIASRLVDGGEYLMPVDNYGFSRRFGWLQDRYGVSWQLNLE